MTVDIESLHNQQGCYRCVHVGYEIFDSKEGKGDPFEDHSHHLIASCSLHISLAKAESDDEVFVDDLDHNLCFEPSTSAPETSTGDEATPSLNENTPDIHQVPQ